MEWTGDWHMGWMGWMALWWFIVIIPVLITAVWSALSVARRDRAQASPEQVLKRRADGNP